MLGAVALGATHGGAPPVQGPDVAGSPVAAPEPPASGEENVGIFSKPVFVISFAFIFIIGLF